jgi:hypothetical protein
MSFSRGGIKEGQNKEKEIKFMKNQNIMFTKSVPKTSKARLFGSVLALGVVALIMHVSAASAQVFTVADLNGAYADQGSGFGSQPGPPRLLCAVLRCGIADV